MKITFLTLFPDFYNSFKENSIIKRAMDNKVVDIETINIRDFSFDKHKRVDDITVGGGPGMIMKCEPIVNAINSIKTGNSKVIFLSSRGKIYNQQKAREFANDNKNLILLCGHYEGIDERILDYVDEEICIGDYILTGGEIPSLVVADSVIRLLDGAIKKDSHIKESYENGLLEYPQYTAPKIYDGKEIPEILFCGNHNVIRKWRLKESLKITLNKRMDLVENKSFNKEELELIEEIKENKIGKWEIDAIKKSKKIKVYDFKVKENDEICFIYKNEYIYKKILNTNIYKNLFEFNKKFDNNSYNAFVNLNALGKNCIMVAQIN